MTILWEEIEGSGIVQLLGKVLVPVVWAVMNPIPPLPKPTGEGGGRGRYSEKMVPIGPVRLRWHGIRVLANS